MHICLFAASEIVTSRNLKNKNIITQNIISEAVPGGGIRGTNNRLSQQRRHNTEQNSLAFLQLQFPLYPILHLQNLAQDKVRCRGLQSSERLELTDRSFPTPVFRYLFIAKPVINSSDGKLLRNVGGQLLRLEEA
ncbi:hypothetical protein AVEN_84805-1 [Araneus ventricosus]|uniref:Uncharacterized protein n=1 Tax=Araneus ventricosus TaxID=182803 RepID=A0A4Y2WZC4_ARAVE|nr:hypothetical protein AVEN_84805-1 [Araneus ventricosus]